MEVWIGYVCAFGGVVGGEDLGIGEFEGLEEPAAAAGEVVTACCGDGWDGDDGREGEGVWLHRLDYITINRY